MSENSRILKDPVKRNILGTELEKMGSTDSAIELYELNIAECFEGNYPYDRLATIYRKRKQPEEEIRVLDKAIKVFEGLRNTSPRQDIEPKLIKFRSRLAKLNK